MHIQPHVFFSPFHIVGQGILIRVVVCEVSAIAVLGFLFPFFVELMSIVNDECKVNFVLSEILQFIIFFLPLNCKILINFALSVISSSSIKQHQVTK